MDTATLRAYHSVKMDAVRRTDNAVLFACETVPNILEVRVLTRLLNEKGCDGWLSLVCRNAHQLSSGEAVCDAIDALIANNALRRVRAVGFNCTHPKHIDALLILAKRHLRQRKSDLLLMAYPNSGEEWDAVNKEWKANTTMTDDEFARRARRWVALGANIVGGCCRTTPNTIKVMRETILKQTDTLSGAMVRSKL